jgi:UPF0755 protein
MDAPDSAQFTNPVPRRVRVLLIVSLVFVLLLCSVGAFIVQRAAKPPIDFPIATPIVIKEGETVADIVATFKAANVVRSELLLYIALLTQYTPADIKASTYVFDQPYDTFAIAKKLAAGNFTSTLVRLTHREGERVSLLAESVHTALPTIATSTFTAAALPYEGTLFPETYFLPPHFTSEDVIKTLRDSYETFITPLRPAITSSGLTETEVVILASIVEREADTPESMAMVAGILRNRLDIGMPLQADASMEYVLDKPLGALVPDDLKIDSPYNTYLNKGLPPTAIGNPGAVAIRAVLEPTPSDYLFYITGNDGNFYYATTYADHKRNIARYLQ